MAAAVVLCPARVGLHARGKGTLMPQLCEGRQVTRVGLLCAPAGLLVATKGSSAGTRPTTLATHCDRVSVVALACSMAAIPAMLDGPTCDWLYMLRLAGRSKESRCAGASIRGPDDPATCWVLATPTEVPALTRFWSWLKLASGLTRLARSPLLLGCPERCLQEHG